MVFSLFYLGLCRIFDLVVARSGQDNDIEILVLPWGAKSRSWPLPREFVGVGSGYGARSLSAVVGELPWSGHWCTWR